jgi:hypothetical protein
MLAYLIERRLSGGKWQIVGWFASFRPAMSTACTLEPARLSVADLEAAPGRRRGSETAARSPTD